MLPHAQRSARRRAGLPLVGHLPAYLRDRLEFFARCADAPEAVLRYRLANTGYLVSDPEDIRHVLVRNHRNYRKARAAGGPASDLEHGP